MTEGGTERRREPRLLIPGREALRRVQEALACDAEAAVAWLRLQVMRTAVQVYAGIHPLAYHPSDTSGKAKAASETSRYPLTAADIVGDGAFDWSTVSVDERHLKNALAAERADPDQPIDCGRPPRDSVPFAVAIEMARKVSGFGEEAARAWLLDALFVNTRVSAWCQPTQRYPAWKPARAGSKPGQLYVTVKVLAEALAAEFPEASPETHIEGEQLEVYMAAASLPEPVVPHDDGPLGRPSYEYWPEVEAAARRHLEYEGGETEKYAQARLANFMKQRIVALGHKAPVRGTLGRHAKKVIKAHKADKYQ